jgi:cytochrome c oxidase cbb3-type subunit 3
VFYATIAFSVVYMVLYPAIPTLSGYTEGLLGWDRRDELRQEIQEANAAQRAYVQEIQDTQLAKIPANNDLLNFAMAGGESAFADNCAPCHGKGGGGLPGGYPTLADDAWIWGGEIEQIHQTIQYGVRNEHDQSRASMMPNYGQILSEEQIAQVATYVYSLSNDVATGDAVAAGQKIFTQNCAACHGANGKGNPALGAPNLTDAIWLYGGEKSEIMSQIRNPQHGKMPAWTGRLEPETIKMLAVYVHALGGGQ